MLFVGIRKYDDVIKVDIAIFEAIEDFFGKSLERGRSILDSKWHPGELEEAPGSIYTHFQLVFFFYWYKMEGSRDIDFAEDFTLFNVISELVDVWEAVGILNGQLIQFSKISTASFCPVRFCL